MPHRIGAMTRPVITGLRADHRSWRDSLYFAGNLLKGHCLRQRMRQNRKRLARAGLLQEKRQIERAAETESVPAHARGIRQGHVGEALEQHGQQDDANGSPRQVRARAMMRAVAKNLVRIGLAQPVVVLAIYKHGRDTEEVQATRRWLREAPSRY